MKFKLKIKLLLKNPPFFATTDLNKPFQMNHIEKIEEMLFPQYKICRFYSRFLFSFELGFDQMIYFYCQACKKGTIWTHNTILQRSRISFPIISRLIYFYLENRTIKDVYKILISSDLNFQVNIKTIRHYFNIFDQFSLEYYKIKLDTTVFEGQIEIDETLLFKQKKTSARHRYYKLGKIWILGIKKRNSNDFLILPIASRSQTAIISVILRYVKSDSYLYTDCYSAYVDNRAIPKKSKLACYGYKHQFVCHKEEFVSTLFPTIHSNTVERLWRELKNDFRIRKTRHKYIMAIARFVFLRSLDREEQIDFIIKNLSKNK